MLEVEISWRAEKESQKTTTENRGLEEFLTAPDVEVRSPPSPVSTTVCILPYVLFKHLEGWICNSHPSSHLKAGVISRRVGKDGRGEVWGYVRRVVPWQAVREFESLYSQKAVYLLYLWCASLVLLASVVFWPNWARDGMILLNLVNTSLNTSRLVSLFS